MRTLSTAWTAVLLTAVLARPGAAQSPSTGYQNAAELQRSIELLARDHRTVVTMSEVARSPGMRPVTAIRLGAGTEPDGRPALLILANTLGPHVVGSEVAMRVAAQLAAG